MGEIKRRCSSSASTILRTARCSAGGSSSICWRRFMRRAVRGRSTPCATKVMQPRYPGGCDAPLRAHTRADSPSKVHLMAKSLEVRSISRAVQQLRKETTATCESEIKVACRKGSFPLGRPDRAGGGNQSIRVCWQRPSKQWGSERLGLCKVFGWRLCLPSRSDCGDSSVES